MVSTGQEAGPGGAHQPQYLLIASDLREAIASGAHGVGEVIPTQHALTARYHVSRRTAQRAVEELRSWGLIDAGVRGRGPRVVARGAVPHTLTEYIADAFRAEDVTLDVLSFTTERLSKVVTRQLESTKEAAGTWPKTIRLRMLLPSLEAVHPLPYLLADPADSRPLKRLRRLIRMYAGQLEHSLVTLKEDGLVPSVSVAIRGMPVLPMQKLYVLNGAQALTSFYRIRTNKVELGPGDGAGEIMDLESGVDLFTWTGHPGGDTPREEAYFDQLQLLFERYWSKLSAPLVLSE
ncbi:hypothetical protein A8W25_16440 [Streptomyces sp. ERV7]|uniref:GntR family transcriptional regulator n=1 Tax=Streptomyces sp. ERV7 TaxID=1322334 RepID=UPI0007F4EFF7|nr:GntR family transcriptional regulator [Streptomyces sp. ERV7]OAR24049.1 hypothetical protein A8W25_16440 [Streptomyces sp. ERV7]